MEDRNDITLIGVAKECHPRGIKGEISPKKFDPRGLGHIMQVTDSDPSLHLGGTQVIPGSEVSVLPPNEISTNTDGQWSSAPRGILKHCPQKIRELWITLQTSSILPNVERSLDAHPEILSWQWSMSGAYALALG